MRTTIAAIAVLTGASFMLVAGLGVARLPDLYTRMHAATKPATVGVVSIMSGVALALNDLPVTARAALVALFFLLTAPVAAHAVARSAHTRRVPLAPGTAVEDEAQREPRARSRVRDVSSGAQPLGGRTRPGRGGAPRTHEPAQPPRPHDEERP